MMLDLCHGSGWSRPLPLVYTRASAPATTPVDVARARQHLRLDGQDADETETSLIEAAIAAAVEQLDGRVGTLGRALITQTWQAITDRPGRISIGGGRSVAGFLLELPPIQAVTKVECLSAGEYVTVPAGKWRTLVRPGGMVAVTSTLWPAADNDPAAWRVTFQAGYGDAGDAVPAPIRAAILLMVADLYDNRDGKVASNLVENPTIKSLLAPYRTVGV